ncbi:ribonuclease E activity regulator RraA [Chromohalobacter sp. TMW 2.2308]|uniref:ribonuclease E activity regulator RraA n=1 Tax=Chromohalobacter TaxID=42054 RepID=UPI00045CF4B8|nr:MULTISPECIES: ribonuclease E activity regulator RraA [Chromohalobacter]MCK2043900.1 ribonuclease E activity regulator RraA [Chromohalobacter moromii]MCK2046415.1 ribonuclease E activity regulator RraA [Chromohalobacter moromii]MCT8515975.1 ribonuclease E activity regulator RraA [Chromohalobacter sp. TMW 2.2271]CDQ36339.1 Putative regulator of ribonuclease activity [Virgibacillus halodenitrificans]
MPTIITPDICDAYPDVKVIEPSLVNVGGHDAFYGPVRTVKCFEDNSRVKEAVNEPGDGAILVVDGGGSWRCALLGDMLAAKAADNGWAGIIVHGCVRDVDILNETPLGIQALGTHPRKSEKRGEGQRDIPITFGGVTIAPGQWLYADNNGIVIAHEPLTLDD